ncbi:hypothetical protein [Streptomyces sp. NPDC054784]
MFDKWRNDRAVRRVTPGDGRPLKRFRRWQLPFRALLHLRLQEHDGRPLAYTVDVMHWQSMGSDKVTADLYLDGHHHAACRLPAAFPVPGGLVEVRMSSFGLRRCHYVTHAGSAHQLTPDPRSAEGRRARFERAHPALSRYVGYVSAAVLTVSLLLLVPQLVAPFTEIEPVAERLGTRVSPVRLPVWLNAGLVLATLAASMERALRLRYHWLLDGAAN